MPQKPPQGDDAPKVTDQALKVQVEIDLDEYYTRLQNELRSALTDLQQQGLEGDALADAIGVRLQSLSDKPIEEMGRASTSEVNNLGRNEEAQDNEEIIGEVVRSEVLDENTCPPCATLDGKVVEFNSSDYFKFMPPNFCNGREFCRGLYIYRKRAA